MYEQFMGDFTFRHSASRQVLFNIYELREFYEGPACSISNIFQVTAVLRLSSLTLTYAMSTLH